MREPLLAPRIGDHPIDRGKRGAKAGELGLRLAPGAEQPEGVRTGLGQEPGRDGARCTGPQLPQALGLDEREQLRPVGREQRHDDPRAAVKRRVRLEPSDAQLQVSGRHDVQESFVEPHAKTRSVLDAAAGDPLEAGFDGLHGVLGRKQLVDVGLTQVEGHWGD